jgi:hypothetical protein
LAQWQEISLPAGSWSSDRPTQREVIQFGQPVSRFRDRSPTAPRSSGCSGMASAPAPAGGARAGPRRVTAGSPQPLVWIALDVLWSRSWAPSGQPRGVPHRAALQSLTEASQRIAAERRVRVSVDTTDELQVLAQAFQPDARGQRGGHAPAERGDEAASRPPLEERVRGQHEP